jgi:hypothetical protein
MEFLDLVTAFQSFVAAAGQIVPGLRACLDRLWQRSAQKWAHTNQTSRDRFEATQHSAGSRERCGLCGLHIGIDLDMRWGSTTLEGTEDSWDGTGSVADASRALGFSRANGYDLVRRGEFPCRGLRVGRTTRVVNASLLRVLESGDPEYNGSQAIPCTRS